VPGPTLALQFLKYPRPTAGGKIKVSYANTIGADLYG